MTFIHVVESYIILTYWNEAWNCILTYFCMEICLQNTFHKFCHKKVFPLCTYAFFISMKSMFKSTLSNDHEYSNPVWASLSDKVCIYLKGLIHVSIKTVKVARWSLWYQRHIKSDRWLPYEYNLSRMSYLLNTLAQWAVWKRNIIGYNTAVERQSVGRSHLYRYGHFPHALSGHTPFAQVNTGTCPGHGVSGGHCLVSWQWN